MAAHLAEKSEIKLSHFYSRKCKKESKLDANMTKELQRAAKAEDREVICQIDENKILFKGKKNEEIAIKNIVRKRKNKEHKIIVAVTKAEKKDQFQVYAMKLRDKDEFTKFWDLLNIETEGPAMKKPDAPPTVNQSHTSQDKIKESRHSPTPRNPMPTAPRPSSSGSSVHNKTRTRTDSETSASLKIVPNQNHQKQRSTSSSSSSSAHSNPPRMQYQPYPLPSTTTNRSVSSYVTTDVLLKNNAKVVSAKDIYPIKKSSKKEKSKAELKYLNYIPGKGIVKSDENVYLYASRVQRDSNTTTSSSSPSSGSTSPSPIDNFDPAPVFCFKASKIAPSRSADRSSSLSTSSSSTTTSNYRQKAKLNVWRHKMPRSLSSSSSSSSSPENTLDRPINARKSRSRSVTYVECPTCHRRSVSRKRNQ